MSVISRFEIFASLTPLEASIIERSVYKRKFKTGERIVTEGDAAVGIYLIDSGEVAVFKSVKGQRVDLATIKAGNFFGELTMLREGPRIASVVATEPTTVLCLFRPEFLNILHHYPSICAKFIARFSDILVDRVVAMYAALEKYRDVLDDIER